MKPELDTISENYSKLRLFYTLDTVISKNIII